MKNNTRVNSVLSLFAAGSVLLAASANNANSPAEEMHPLQAKTAESQVTMDAREHVASIMQFEEVPRNAEDSIRQGYPRNGGTEKSLSGLPPAVLERRRLTAEEIGKFLAASPFEAANGSGEPPKPKPLKPKKMILIKSLHDIATPFIMEKIYKRVKLDLIHR